MVAKNYGTDKLVEYNEWFKHHKTSAKLLIRKAALKNCGGVRAWQSASQVTHTTISLVLNTLLMNACEWV